MGFRNLMRDRSYRHDRQAHQSVAPAQDRRHDGASFRGEGPEGLHSIPQELRGFSRPLARYRQRRGPSSVGYVLGNNVEIESQFWVVDGQEDEMEELARELVDLKVDVIVTSGLAFMPRTR